MYPCINGGLGGSATVLYANADCGQSLRLLTEDVDGVGGDYVLRQLHVQAVANDDQTALVRLHDRGDVGGRDPASFWGHDRPGCGVPDLPTGHHPLYLGRRVAVGRCAR